MKILIYVHLFLEILLIFRVLLRPHRDPVSRVAWIAVIATLPVIGVLAYLLFGEVRIGRRWVKGMDQAELKVQNALKNLGPPYSDESAKLSLRKERLFDMGRSVSGFSPVDGNNATLLKDSNSTIDQMVSDFDAAANNINILFYIWMTDNNGLKIVEALIRAAKRGVICRAIADGMGSRNMIQSKHWRRMKEAGVKLAVALPVGSPLLRIFTGRIDLRNHRKIVVIDGQITFCGSQNCADPEFLVKAKYAPWVDAVVRFEGPIAIQNLALFMTDWITYTNEDITSELTDLKQTKKPGFPAQVIGSGPTTRNSSMPQVFETLIYSATEELVISTPYYVPNESLQNALCACAYRGVKVSIIFPHRNDSWIVGGASKSFYEELLNSGVQIFEFKGGLLHTKSLTIDGKISLIGSANMDRRSFDLNYENNILFCDETLAKEIRKRQEEYKSKSIAITLSDLKSWSLFSRLKNNTLAMLGPVL